MPTPREAEVHEPHESHEPHEQHHPMDEPESAEPLLDRLETVGEKVTHFVVERPLTAVAIAVGIGFLFGRMTRR